MPTPATRRSRIDAGAAIWAGLVAGLVFMVAGMLMVATFPGGSAWEAPRMIGAVALGRDVLPPPDTFDGAVFAVAMAIHFALSILLGFVFAFIAGTRTVGTSALVGALFGLVVYAISFYGLTAVFPWLAEARNWATIFAHLLFGVALGAVYASRTRHRHVRGHPAI